MSDNTLALYKEQEMRRSFFSFGRPSVLPAVPFEPLKDIEQLYAACNKMFGADGGVIAKILGRRTGEQRAVIAEAYQAKYSKALEEVMKKKTSGDFQKLIMPSLLDPISLRAALLEEALQSKKPFEGFVDVLISISNHEMRALKEAYFMKYQKKLEEVVEHHFKDLEGFVLSRAVEGDRNEPTKEQILYRNFDGMVCSRQAISDAKFWYQEGLMNINKGDYRALGIMMKRSKAQLKYSFAKFEKLSKSTVVEEIKRLVDKKHKDVAVMIAQATESPEEYFADRLNYSMKGIGTKDILLRNLILLRNEVDLEDVKVAYRFKYNKDLSEDIFGDTSGDYKTMLVSLVGF